MTSVHRRAFIYIDTKCITVKVHSEIEPIRTIAVLPVFTEKSVFTIAHVARNRIRTLCIFMTIVHSRTFIYIDTNFHFIQVEPISAFAVHRSRRLANLGWWTVIVNTLTFCTEETIAVVVLVTCTDEATIRICADCVFIANWFGVRTLVYVKT